MAYDSQQNSLGPSPAVTAAALNAQLRNATRFLMSEFAKQPHPDATHRDDVMPTIDLLHQSLSHGARGTHDQDFLPHKCPSVKANVTSNRCVET